MRIIDLDKVRWKDGFYDMHTGEQFSPMMFNTPEWLEWAIAEAEVKAIPIEWIKNYGVKKAEKCCHCATAIWELLEDWEKEDECRSNTGDV